jgi:hypothetical protein
MTASLRASGNENEAVRRTASFYFSASVWPSGGRLPRCRVERATQVRGWFGLAIDGFPGHRVAKPQSGAVEKLAR